MVLYGVPLPPLPTLEDDMEVDQEQPNYSAGYTADVPMDGRDAYSKGLSPYEEQKMSNEFMKKAVVESNDQYGISKHAVPPAKGDHSFDKSMISQNSGLDRTTFKPQSDNAPADLDFDDFGAKPSSEDLEFIDKIQDKHFHFLDSLKQRNQKLQNILSLYNPYKSVNMTLNALGQMNDIGVSNDVCAALFTEGKFIETLSIKQALSALPY